MLPGTPEVSQGHFCVFLMREGSEHNHQVEDSDWYQIDSYEASMHQIDLRRRMGKGGYREVVLEVEDMC